MRPGRKSDRTRIVLMGLLLGGGAAVPAALLASCASMPPDDCGSRNNCAAPTDDSGVDATMPMDAQGDTTQPPAEASPESSSLADASEGGTEASAMDAGLDGADGSDGFDGYTCDPSKTPQQDPCVLQDTLGVFVSPQGLDSNAGTANAPLHTVGAGIVKAIALGRSRVYVCDGAYAESVRLTSAVNLYGGLTCASADAGWGYADGGQAQVTSAANAVALTVDGVDASVSVEDLRWVSPDAVGQDDAGNGQSSIAAWVNGSTVVFRRCAFVAGAGANGADGVTGSNYTAATAPDGQPNEAGVGGVGGSTTCGDRTSTAAGFGGSATTTTFSDGGSGSAMPMPPVNSAMAMDGVGGAGGFSCASGHKGAPGLASDGGAAATNYGSVTPTAWIPSAGGAGFPGSPGQGGGGGGGTAGMPSLGGTGGGAGGCGGAGGTGGAGGGGSVALTCIASAVALADCVLATSDAGAGGRGGAGQGGQGGGALGSPNPAGACAGGFGGNGAGGGGGAGGIGGISVCVVYRGVAPTGSPRCTVGAGGVGGVAGVGGDGGANGSNQAGPAGLTGADGGAGLTAMTLAVP